MLAILLARERKKPTMTLHPNRKIKILFDGQQLAKAFMQQQTGIFRVSDEVFRRLCRRSDVEIYFLMTQNKGEPERYLASIGHPEVPVVWMPKLLRTTKYHNIFHKVDGGLLRLVMPFFYGDKLRKFDVYFSPYPPISPVVYRCGIKTVCICHDVIPFQFPHFCAVYGNGPAFKDYVKKMAADFVFFVSQSVRRDFLTYRMDFPYEKTAVIYPGADGIDVRTGISNTEKLAVRKKYKIPMERYILVLSEGNPRKNFIHIIRSFLKYLRDFEDDKVSLVVGGRKLPKYDYVKIVSDLLEQYSDRIVITGHIANEDLHAIYEGASLFLYPSLYEGFGLPLLEAMMHGVPVITANNSSLLEVCKDAAVCVSGFDIAETANAINRILSDDIYADQLRQKGFRRVKIFSFDTMVSEMMEKVYTVIHN
ncbi:MAG: glycosyltransferase family 4 protein [Holosporaceae bacterium]|jgi:glycosyltransferase involved in cell wall biosynthesis|nr:glycosyltransferase family 4 protein [Holosporaceae bacterium]